MRSRKQKRAGFSLMEIIAAVIILAVVATATVSTIAPMREKSKLKIDETNIAKLNGQVQAYLVETNAANPDYWMTYLNTNGYTPEKYNKTPYGGYYNWNATTKTVENRYRPK